MSSIPWRTGIVTKVINETYNTRRYFIQVEELESFDFKPGQFVTLDLPIHEKLNKRWRSYSIASWPDGSNIFELLIVYMKDGAGTNYLFQEVDIGSELLFRGPQGIFVLPETIENDLFFICTGTGIAPFRSMIQYLQLHKIDHRKIYLIFGCRTQKDLLYLEEMKKLEREMDNYYFIPTLSREKWTGASGYVHDRYTDICKANREMCENLTDLQPASFYLCGWKAMLDDARQKIVDLGYDKKSIYFESYG